MIPSESEVRLRAHDWARRCNPGIERERLEFAGDQQPERLFSVAEAVQIMHQTLAAS